MTSFCVCLLEGYADQPGILLTTIGEALFSFVICIIGIILNWKILKRLKSEKQSKPLERKGNVVEPIMRWFCMLQMVSWPFHLTFYWIWKNGFIPLAIPTWLCRMVVFIITTGRSITAYNSLFLALIRYIYIVHDKKANKWQFESVGSLFQVASISVPLTINFMALLRLEPTVLKDDFVRKKCPYTYNATTEKNVLLMSEVREILIEYVPDLLVHAFGIVVIAIHLMVFLNVTEAYLYVKMFLKVKR